MGDTWSVGEIAFKTLEQLLTAVLNLDGGLMITLAVVVAFLVPVGYDRPGAVGNLASKKERCDQHCLGR
jgi:hypothetical protein